MTARYLHGPQIDHVLAEEDAAGIVRWALADQQGSVRDVADSAGTILNHVVYDGFGTITSQTAPALEPRFGYTGRERDGESGLWYYRRRYYDAGTGRFISQDPLGFGAGDGNLYRYVGNSPVNLRDPMGLCAEDGEAARWDEYLAEQANQLALQRDVLARVKATLEKIENGYLGGAAATAVLLEVRAQLMGAGFDPSAVRQALNPYASALAQQVMVQAEANRWYTSAERLQGSLSILGSKVGTDYMGLTDSSQYHGSVFVGARAGASVTQAGLLALGGYGVFSGLGAIAAGGGTVGTAAAGAQATMLGAGGFLSGMQIGHGINNIADGNYIQGTADVYLGTVGAVVSVFGANAVKFPGSSVPQGAFNTAGGTSGLANGGNTFSSSGASFNTGAGVQGLATGGQWYASGGPTMNTAAWAPKGGVSSANPVASESDYVNLASGDRTIHILYGDPGMKGGGHLWPGFPGKSAFPESWSAPKVMHKISDIATDPSIVPSFGKNGNMILRGTRDGIEIEVILARPGGWRKTPEGGIVTGYPTNVPRNPK